MREKWKWWQISYFWAPKSMWMVTSAMKLRHLLLGRKAMTNLDSILKSRDINLPTKVQIVKAMVSPVFLYGCEMWTIKMVECWRINAFELWCWRRLLRVLCTARRSNQSILNKINPEYSLEGLMLKLKLQYFGHLMQRADLLEKALMNDWKQEGKGTMDGMVGWYHWLNGHEFEQTQGDGEVVKDRKAWHAAVHGVTDSTEQQLPYPYEPFLITNQTVSFFLSLCMCVCTYIYTMYIHISYWFCFSREP